MFSRFAGDANVFSWNNAAYTPPNSVDYNYTLPNPFSFNLTLQPVQCQGYCPVYYAEYGPFTGNDGNVQLALSPHAQVGQYILQTSFFDAAKDTKVYFGYSDNFTIAAGLEGDPFKPTYEADSSQSSTAFRTWTSWTILFSILFSLFAVR